MSIVSPSNSPIPEPECNSSILFASLREEENLRGERFAWIMHWVLYGLLLIFLLIVHFVQNNKVGSYGLVLLAVPIAVNLIASKRILKKVSIPWLRYVYTFVDLTNLTLYNAMDTYFNSTLTPVTTATLLIYPIILFMASLENDRRLIISSTIYCVLAMNLLFAIAYPFFDPEVAPTLVCGNIECQVYRTGYILLFGGLLLIFPATLARLLHKQKLLFEQNQEQFALAHHDSLTGLPNRRLFTKFLEKVLPLARRHRHQFAILYLDLDGFKTINDTLGHDAGDEVLREVAARLLTLVRDSDMVARFGGDEFVVIAQKIEGRPGAEGLADRILDAIHAPMQIHGEWVPVGASIGISLFPEDSESAERLIELADEALYKVKKNGKDGSAFV